MERKAASGLMLTLLLIGMCSLAFNIKPVKTGSKTWTVDDDEGTDSTKIQEGTNATNPGDPIFAGSATHIIMNGENQDNYPIVNSLTPNPPTFQRMLVGKVPLYYAQGAREITSGDFNNDGLLDLATVHGPGQVFIWYNKGAGIFQEIQIGNVDDETWGICSGDFDGNGWEDLATNVRLGHIYIFYNKGNEVFEKVYVGDFLEVGDARYGFTSEDFDDDGWMDLALGVEWFSEGQHYNRLYVLYNKGDNIFEKVHIGEDIAPDMILKPIASGDINEDGLTDIVACTVYGGAPSKIFIFYNRGDNIFETVYLGSYDDDITGLTLGDFNKDGLIDIAASPLYDHLYILYNLGDGTFTEKVFIGYVGFYASGLAVGDFDRNGFLDIAACNMGWSLDPWSRVYIFYNQVMVTISATINIDPDTLNLRSKGQWITAYIQLPEDYNAEDIDATTILLNETIQPVLDPKYSFVTNSSEYLVDHNEDGILQRMVKFNRTEVASWIYSDLSIEYGNVTLTIAGELYDEIPFEETDIIKVLFPGDA